MLSSKLLEEVPTMNNSHRILTIAKYEWRRALARKKVALLITLTIIAEFLPYIVLTQLPIPQFIQNVKSFMWLAGTLLPHGLLLQFIAIFIATGSTAEEYEQGTADTILSKPIKRTEYLLGKFIGGYTLFAFIALLTSFLALILSYSVFGPQQSAEYAPAIYLAIVFSTLVFFSIGFMTGELFRVSSLAYLVSSTTFISALILGPILILASNLTGDPFYLDVVKWLPNWGALNLPTLAARALFLQNLRLPFGGGDTSLTVSGSILESIISIAIYASVPMAITILRFLKSDITNKSAG